MVDLDMRNSRMDEIFTLEKEKGMSSYLADSKLTPDDVISKVPQNSNLYVAWAGVVPPNPIQLLLGKRLGEFLRAVRDEYDIILLDTAPVLLVADALVINRLCDATIYVTRAGVTQKRFLQTPEGLYREGKLKKLSYVAKGIMMPSKYGYGYGYGYGRQNKSASKKTRRLFGSNKGKR